MNTLKLIACSFILALSLACGGGGSAEQRDAKFSHEEETRRTFKLYPDHYQSKDYQERYDMSGTDQFGKEVTATLIISNIGEQNQRDKSSFYIEQNLNLFFDNGASKHRRIINKSTENNIINNRIYPEEDKYKPNQSEELVLPNAAEVGNYGLLFKSFDSQNQEETYWSIENYNANQTKLVLRTEIKNEKQQTTYYEEACFTITQQGIRQHCELLIRYPLENIEIRLQ